MNWEAVNGEVAITQMVLIWYIFWLLSMVLYPVNQKLWKLTLFWNLFLIWSCENQLTVKFRTPIPIMVNKKTEILLLFYFYLDKVEWHCLKCFAKISILPKDFFDSATWRFSFMNCIDKSSFVLYCRKVFQADSHLNISVSTAWDDKKWLLSFSFLLNLDSHKSHLKGLANWQAYWVLTEGSRCASWICLVRLSALVNDFSHNSHWNLMLLPCTLLICRFSVLSAVKFLLHVANPRADISMSTKCVPRFIANFAY